MGIHGHSRKEADIYSAVSKIMAESEGIKETVNQVAIKAGMTVMMASRQEDTGPQPSPQQTIGSCRDKGIVNQYLKSHNSTGTCMIGM